MNINNEVKRQWKPLRMIEQYIIVIPNNIVMNIITNNDGELINSFVKIVLIELDKIYDPAIKSLQGDCTKSLLLEEISETITIFFDRSILLELLIISQAENEEG